MVARGVFAFLVLAVGSLMAAETGQIEITSFNSRAQVTGLLAELAGCDKAGALTEIQPLIFWNLSPGTYQVVLKSKSGDSLATITTFVYPKLTSRIDVAVIQNSWAMVSAGFADQFGGMLTIDPEIAANLPGGIADGLVAFSDTDRAASQVSWEGISLATLASQTPSQMLSAKPTDYALINFGSPVLVAGEPGVELVHDSRADREVAYQATYASRDGRYHLGHLHQSGWGDRVVLFGTGAFDNLADAAPRSNVDHRLPHNNLKGGEVLGGLNVTPVPRLSAGSRVWYTDRERNYYVHPYMFDMDHAPRSSETRFKTMNTIRWKLQSKTLAEFSGGYEFEETKLGDGTYFDDAAAYVQPDGNPRWDRYSLVYSWDDPSTTVDETHVYETYAHRRSSHWNIGAALHQELAPATQFTAAVDFQKGSYRKYLNYHAWTMFPEVYADRIGFDLLGDGITNDNGIATVPRPQQFRISADLKTIQSKYGAYLKLEYVRFESGSLTLRNQALPMDPDSVQFTTPGDSLANVLDLSDLGKATPLEHINFIAGINARVSPSVDVYGGLSMFHRIPRPDQMYVGLTFFEHELRIGSDGSPIGNPGLPALRDSKVGFGATIRRNGVTWCVGVDYHWFDDEPVARFIVSRPNSFALYSKPDHQSRFGECALAMTTERSGLLTGMGVASLRYGSADTSVPYIGYFPPKQYQSLKNHVEYNLAAAVTVDLNHVSDRFSPASNLTRLVKRLAVTGMVHFRSPLRYPQTAVYNELVLFGSAPDGWLPPDFHNARPFAEVNFSLRATLAKSRMLTALLRIEVLNVFNRINVVRVYTGTGLPDNTAYLSSFGGQNFILNSGTPNRAGLTGEQEYRLMENDPNNFGRPRTVRMSLEIGL